jgi:cardiolipin synthase
MSKFSTHIKAVIIIVVILAVSFIIVLLGLLFIPTSRSDKDIVIVGDASSTTPNPNMTSFTAGSPTFLRTLSSVTNAPIDHGENIKIIDNGNDFMNDLIAEINSASSSINFTLYPWSNGTFSNDVFAALTAAARRGVTVRVLLDAVGGHTVPSNLIAILTKAGGRVAKYHQFSLLHPYQFDERDHARAIVIDGGMENETAFFGGMGIGDDWLESTASTSNANSAKNPADIWKDMMFEVKGGMAESLENDFAELWNETTGEIIAEPARLALAIVPMEMISSTTVPYINIMSIPSSGGLEPIRDIFLMSMSAAQKSIYIVSPYLMPDRGILDELETKARAGLDVRIVSPGDTTFAPLLRDAWHADYGELLKAGVKLYEYEPTMDHEKYMVIDGDWSVVGSANLDSRSESLNAENVMGIADPVLVTALTKLYVDDIAASKQITVADWQSWSWFSKVWSRFLTTFAKQI